MDVFPEAVRIPQCRGKYLLCEIYSTPPQSRIGHPTVGVYEKVEHDATAPALVYLTFEQATRYMA